jgi:epsin
MRAVWSVVNTPDARTWRQIYKGLQLLDVLVRHGSERVIDDVRQQLFRIKALLHFEHAESARDQGAGIRDAAKKLISLLDDTALLRDERRKARALAKKVVGMSSDGSNFSGAGAGLSNSNFHDESPRRNGGGGNSGDNAWSARGGSHNEDTEDNHDYFSSSSTHTSAATDHYVPKAHASDLSARHTSRAAVRKGGRAHASTEADDEAFAAPATDVDADFFGSAFAAAAPAPHATTDDLDFGPPVSAPARMPIPVSVPISAPRMQVNVRPQAVAVVAPPAASFDPFNYSGQGQSQGSSATRVVAPELDFFSTPAPSTAPIAAAAAAAVEFDPFGFSGGGGGGGATASHLVPVHGASNPFANNARMAPALTSPSSDFGTFSSAAPAGLVDSDVDRLVSFDKLSLKGGGESVVSHYNFHHEIF